LDGSPLTELQVDKLILIGTDLGPHVQLAAFAASCKTRSEFCNHIATKCQSKGTIRLSSVKPDLSNLDEIATLYGWKSAASPPELSAMPSFWCERDAAGNFLLCDKATGCKQIVAGPMDPMPRLVYSNLGFYELLQYGCRVRCEHIMEHPSQYTETLNVAKAKAKTT